MMMFWKSRSNRSPKSKFDPRVADGQRLYAIGDIHGRLDLFDTLLDTILRDDQSRPPAETHLILLGDLIDRGPESASVVERALEIERDHPNAHFLLGNHEEVFLKALEGDEKALTLFNRIGGRETILSYGISETDYRGCDYAGLLELLRANVPAAHIAFLQRFEDLIIFGDYAFVHAGVRPGRPLEKQRVSDLRWIRREFLEHEERFEKMIVHGHSISKDVELASNRIGLDTGAFATGNLSAMGFERGERWIMQTSNSLVA